MSRRARVKLTSGILQEVLCKAVLHMGEDMHCHGIGHLATGIITPANNVLLERCHTPVDNHGASMGFLCTMTGFGWHSHGTAVVLWRVVMAVP